MLFDVKKENTGNKHSISTIFMTFGQFLDHDITDTPSEGCHAQTCDQVASFKYPCFSILWDENNYSKCTPFGRSRAICRRRKGTRQQVNILTSFVDGSQIYGAKKELFHDLRKNDGSGLMKLKDNLMELDPKIKHCHTHGGCSLVGDHRGDENIALHSMHTLWVREHNRIAKELKELNPHWDGERVFQEARKINTAVLQHIVFKEWLPMIVRPFRYRGYRPRVNPNIINSFATAAFRFGHSLIPNSFELLDKNFDPINKPITLQHAFFNRKPINQYGIEPTMFGLLGNKSEEVDTDFSFSIARRLFVAPGKEDHVDLMARNIQRGRDHGLPTYGKFRRWCRLRPIRTWDQLKKHMPAKAVHAFKELYPTPSDIELFPAGMAENHRGRRIVGPTFECIIRRQFNRLQKGDRFYYRARGVFSRAQRTAIYRTRLSTVLCNNLERVVSVQRHAFYVAGSRNKRISCNRIPKLELWAWKEKPKHKGKRDEISSDTVSNKKDVASSVEMDIEEELRQLHAKREATPTTPTTTTVVGSERQKSGFITDEPYNIVDEEEEAMIDNMVGLTDIGSEVADPEVDLDYVDGAEHPTTTPTTGDGNSIDEFEVEGEIPEDDLAGLDEEGFETETHAKKDELW
eukprot:TCONS_00064649-protein